jgi:hypothetical protein
MIEKRKVFIKIRLEDDHNGYVIKPKDAQEQINDIVKNAEETGEKEVYVFETVWMTERQFNSLPDFRGF